MYLCVHSQFATYVRIFTSTAPLELMGAVKRFLYDTRGPKVLQRIMTTDIFLCDATVFKKRGKTIVFDPQSFVSFGYWKLRRAVFYIPF